LEGLQFGRSNLWSEVAEKCPEGAIRLSPGVTPGKIPSPALALVNPGLSFPAPSGSHLGQNPHSVILLVVVFRLVWGFEAFRGGRFGLVG
jgi:hypothetical protein